MDARRSPAQQVAACSPPVSLALWARAPRLPGPWAAKPGRPQVPGARAVEVGWGRATCRETPRAGSRTWTRCPCLRAAGSASRSLNGATDIQEFPDLKGTSSLETL